MASPDRLTFGRKDVDVMGRSELIHYESCLQLMLDRTNRHKKKSVSEDQSDVEMTGVDNEMNKTDSSESDVELDLEGLIEPDSEPPQVMGSAEKEVSEENKKKSDEYMMEAMDLHANGKYEEAINAYTKAILLNPKADILYSKRGRCYLEMKKPAACVRDCTKALVINPDSAAAYKCRGRAHRLLGYFVEAAEDLRLACRIDFDEEADEWLKEVTPNVRKIEEHQRKYDRKRLEKELEEVRKRIVKMKEELKERISGERMKADASGEEKVAGMDDAIMNIIYTMQNSDFTEILRDPEVLEAIADVTQSPLNIFKYAKNSKLNRLFLKFMEIFQGKSVDEMEEVSTRMKQLVSEAYTRETSGIGLPETGTNFRYY